MVKKDKQGKKRVERTSGSRDRGPGDIREFLHAEEGETSRMERSLKVVGDYSVRGGRMEGKSGEWNRSEDGDSQEDEEMEERDITLRATGATDRETQEEMEIDVNAKERGHEQTTGDGMKQGGRSGASSPGNEEENHNEGSVEDEEAQPRKWTRCEDGSDVHVHLNECSVATEEVRMDLADELVRGETQRSSTLIVEDDEGARDLMAELARVRMEDRTDERQESEGEKATPGAAMDTGEELQAQMHQEEPSEWNEPWSYQWGVIKVEVTPVGKETWQRVANGTAPRAISREGEVAEQFGNVYLRCEKPGLEGVDDGWAGYKVIVMAKWLSQGIAVQEAEGKLKDFTQEVKEELITLLAQMKTAGTAHGKTEAVKRLLAAGPPYTDLQPALRFDHVTQVLAEDAHISWWHDDGNGKLIYGGHQHPYAINHTRVGKVQETVKVGVLGSRYVIMDGPMVTTRDVVKPFRTRLQWLKARSDTTQLYVADRVRITELWLTPGWAEELEVRSGSVVIKMSPREEGWQDLLQWKLERKSLTREIVQDKVRVYTYLDVLKEYQLNTEARGGWSGYLAAFQAHLMGKGHSMNEVCKSADLWNVKHREQIAKFIESMAGHIEVHEKATWVARMLRCGDFNPDELPAWAAFNYCDPWNYQQMPQTSWWTVRETTAAVTGLSNGKKLTYTALRYQDVEFVRQSVKIVMKGAIHFMVGGPGEEGPSLFETTKLYIGRMATKYNKETEHDKQDEKITSKRRELALMCTEADKEVTHAYVANIRNEFRLDYPAWTTDMTQAFMQAPTKFTETAIREAMRGIVNTEDIANTFAIVIPCDRPYIAGSRTFPTHFVLYGPDRPKLAGEMRMKTNLVRSKYTVHMLDEEEVEQLTRSKIQCVFRGLSANAAVNQFMRQVVADYLREKGLFGRLAMVHDYRHPVLSGMYTETIMVIYLMRTPTDDEVRRGHEAMGLKGQRKDFHHRGVVLDQYKTLGATDGVPLSPVIRSEKPHLVFRYIRWKNYETMVSRLLQMFDINVVDYWYSAMKADGQHIETAVGLSTVIDWRNLPADLLREFVEMQVGAVQAYMRLPFQTPPPFLYLEPGRPRTIPASQPLLLKHEQKDDKGETPKQPEFRLPTAPRQMAPRPGPLVQPSRGWAPVIPTTSEVAMVSSLSSKVNKLEAVLTTVLKESNTMVTSVQNQLRVEREGREKLQSECADLRHEVEQLRQTAKAAEGAIIQMKGTMESALHQMTRAQEENQAQLARSQEEARQESRQQFQLLIDAVRKGPEQGTNDSGYAK